ncbi:MAG: hypothetical protein AB1700_19925, partial [Bacillota bacterium]
MGGRVPLPGSKRILEHPMFFPAAAAAFYVVVRALTGAGLINDYWQLILDQSLIIAVASLGLSLIYGFCGQFSLGHAAFY